MAWLARVWACGALLVVTLCVVPLPSRGQSTSAHTPTLSGSDRPHASLAEQFVYRSLRALRKRREGYQPGEVCKEKVGLGYLQFIRRSKTSFCTPDQDTAAGHRRHLSGEPGGTEQEAADSADSGLFGTFEGSLPVTQSSVDCYYAPYSREGDSAQSELSLCRSRNVVLDSCGFYAGKRKGVLDKKFPLPTRGAVKLACNLEDYQGIVKRDPHIGSIQTEVWWQNAVRDDAAVESSCALGSDLVVDTPTMFLMRDRHANYAHEIEMLSMAFAFMAALDPADVRERGLQIVIADQAPPTGFMENWARLSYPYKLRFLAQDPFPNGTCFRSAYHVHSFAAGIGYNTNSSTVTCESAVLTGFSKWLRAMYHESNASEMQRQHYVSTSGIVVKNVVWLSRRNLEAVRMFLDANPGWKALRLVANEDELMLAMHRAVTTWNSQNCLIKRFNKKLELEYQRGLDEIAASGRWVGALNDGSDDGDADEMRKRLNTKRSFRRRRRLLGADAPPTPPGGPPREPVPEYRLRSNIIALDKLWQNDTGCRKGNVLFKFVDGDFNDMPYHQQLHVIFRTGVLVGVHGAGLTHGYLLPPGQSAVLQLAGDRYADVPPLNVFRNMARNTGNYYEDVVYSGVNINIDQTVKAVLRAMDDVAARIMDEQLNKPGSLRVVLDDQTHFSALYPRQCLAGRSPAPPDSAAAPPPGSAEAAAAGRLHRRRLRSPHG